MPKCRVCGLEVKKATDMIKVEQKKYVCSEDCKTIFFENGETKTPRQELLDYVGQIWENPSYPMIATQIKQLQDNFNFKIEGMLLTLKYCFEVEDKSSEAVYGFKYILEKYYGEAKDFHNDSIRRRKALDLIEEDKVVVCKYNDKERKLAQFGAKIRGVLE